MHVFLRLNVLLIAEQGPFCCCPRHSRIQRLTYVIHYVADQGCTIWNSVNMEGTLCFGALIHVCNLHVGQYCICCTVVVAQPEWRCCRRCSSFEHDRLTAADKQDSDAVRHLQDCLELT